MVRRTLLEERRESGGSVNIPQDVPDKQLGLRLGLSASQNIAFKLDRCGEGDQAVQYRGVSILFVDKDLAKVVDGATLDCVDTESGPRLMLCR